jgi:hypothetical protein
MEATVTTMMNKGKRSLDTLLREKAYSDIVENLEENGIDINEVSDSDIEVLVAERANEMRSGIKSFAVGGAVALLISSLIGV